MLSLYFRATLCRHSSSEGAISASATTIPLGVVKESFWWARFSDEDYEHQKTRSLRTSITLRELLFVLGADQNKGDGDATAAAAAMIRLAPSQCTIERTHFASRLS